MYYGVLPALLLLLNKLKPEHNADIVPIQDLKRLSVGEALPLEELQRLGAIEHGTAVCVRACPALVDTTVTMFSQLRLKPRVVVILLHFLETKDLGGGEKRSKVSQYHLKTFHSWRDISLSLHLCIT